MHIRLKLRCGSGSFPRLLAGLPLVLSLLFVSLTWAQFHGPTDSSAITPAVGSEMRQYYLTRPAFMAHKVMTACAPGFHFASIWEIADPSNLIYNTELGLVAVDSGMGPPTAYKILNVVRAAGWIRTGNTSSINEPPGQANCYGWLSDSTSSEGTTAFLPVDWTAGYQDLGMWEVGISTCRSERRVWCIQGNNLFSDGFETGDTSMWS